MKPKFQVALGLVVAISAVVFGSSCSPATVGSAVLELVPADSIAYGSLSIEEGSDQEQTLEELLTKFEKAPTLAEAKQNIGNAIFEAAGLDIRYDADVEDWLGDEAALFVESFDQDDVTAAGLIETTDQGATQDMMEKIDGDIYEEDPEAKSYKDTDYDFYREAEVASGFVEDFWVIGSEAGFKSVVDTSEGERSLTESQNFDEAESELPPERLGFLYVDLERLSAALEDMGGTASLQLFGNFDLEEAGAAAGALYVQADSAVMEFASKVLEEQEAPSLDAETGAGLISEMPGESWVVFGLEELGKSLTTTFDAFAVMPGGEGLGLLEQQLRAETGFDLQDDILSWMGDGGAFVLGQNLFELQGGFVIESSDPELSSEAIGKLEVYLRAQGIPVRPAEVEGLKGFAIQDPSMPQPINFVAGDKVVIAYGDDATSEAIGASDRLRDSAGYQEAVDLLGDDFAPGLYVNFETLLVFAEALGASTSPSYDEDVKPWLDPLTHMIFGQKLEGDTVIQRFVIGIE